MLLGLRGRGPGIELAETTLAVPVYPVVGIRRRLDGGADDLAQGRADVVLGGAGDRLSVPGAVVFVPLVLVEAFLRLAGDSLEVGCPAVEAAGR